MSNSASMNGGQGQSPIGGWPAYVLIGIVLGAALFSFSPRPIPPFPATQVKPDGLLINGLARNGSRTLAVGELGRILIQDNAGGQWHEAKVDPQRGSMLTQVLFIDDKTAFAVGHDAWILRSEDRGDTWKEVSFIDTPTESAPSFSAEPPPPDAPSAPAAPTPDPLLGIAGPYDGHLFAFGGFGQFMTSQDGGHTWQHVKDDKLSDHHLNGMTRAADGALILVGERGLMLRSTDIGSTWTLLPSVYTGSFFGVEKLPSNTLIAYGMRGNVFASRDNGKTWVKSDAPVGISLFGSTVDPDGAAILVGEGNTVLKSTDDGAHFVITAQDKRERLTTVLPVTGGWLAGGEGGLTILKPGQKPSDPTISKSGKGDAS